MILRLSKYFRKCNKYYILHKSCVTPFEDGIGHAMFSGIYAGTTWVLFCCHNNYISQRPNYSTWVYINYGLKVIYTSQLFKY